MLVVLRELGLELEVERIARLLVPEESVRRERPRVLDRGLEIEAAVRVDRELLARAHDLDHRLDAPQVVVERFAADLHLDDGVAEVEIALHLVLQRLHVLARVVVAAGRVDEDAVVGPAAVVALGEHAVERLLFDLGDRVPDRHVEHADRDRALAVPARLLVRHHARPDLVRIEVVPAVVERAIAARRRSGAG